MPVRLKRRFSWLRPDLLPAAARHGPRRPTARSLLDVLSRLRRLGPRARRQARRTARTAYSARIRTRRCSSSPSSPTPCDYLDRATARPWRYVAWRASPATSADPTGLAWRFSPVSNDKRDQVSARSGTARPDRHRRAQRRPEPAGLRDRRQLRPALGDHPPDPAGRPRRPHRPAGRERSCAIPSCRPTASSGSSACAPRAPAAEGKRRGRRHRRSVLRGRPERPSHPRSVPREGRHPRRRRRHRGRSRPPTPTRSGRTPSTAIPTLQKIVPALPNVVYSHQAAHADAPSSLKACWSTSAPPRATTPWPGWTGTAQRHRVAVRHPQGCRVRARHAGSAAPRQPPRAGTPGRQAASPAKKSPSAGSSAGPPAPASAPTNGSSATPTRSRTRCSPRRELRQAPSRTSTLPAAPVGHRHAQPPAAQRHQRRRPGRAGDRAARRGPAVPSSTRKSERRSRRSSARWGCARPAGRKSAMTLDVASVSATACRASTSRRCSSRSWAGTSTRPQLDRRRRRPDVTPSAPSPRSAACRSSSVRPTPTAASPTMRTRRKIDTQVAKSAHEHLIIYTDAAKTHAGLAMGRAASPASRSPTASIAIIRSARPATR